jgi:hypothetical protein
MQNGGKHAEIVWHRRSGKDELGLHWTAVAAFKRVAQYWYMLPEYSQARKAIWDAINPHTGKKRIDEAFPIELRTTTRNDEMKIIFKNGSSFQAVGSDDPSKLVGSPPAGIVYSEWALSNPATRAYLRPILMENGGWQIFNTTPRGRNHAYTTLEAARNNPDAFAQVLDATETGVFTRAQLEAELQNYIADFGEDYGRSKFEQEYLCSFDAANLGAILARQITISERKGLITDEIEFDPDGQPIQISADLGRRDTATWWFWQPCIGGYNMVDYDSGFGIDAEEWCERLHKKLSKYKFNGGKDALGCIWLPHDARTKTFSAKESAIEIFLKYFGNKKVDITPMTSIADRINAARVVLPRVRFHKTNCKTGLEGLRAWSYAYNDITKTFGSNPLHDWASHDGDGFSYGCQIMQMASPPPPPIEEIKGVYVGQTNVSLDELWKTSPKQTNYKI